MPEETGTRPSWFVGFNFRGKEDQSERFVAEGIWEVDTKDGKYGGHISEMQAGDRIVLKSTFTRTKRKGLPFDNRGQRVSVMRIKATGTIKRNLEDGKGVLVDWTPLDEAREWYFFVSQNTIWRVEPDDWKKKALLAFTFDNQLQDIDRFRNSHFWHERFGDREGEERFPWTTFYSAVAAGLANHFSDRAPLVNGLHEASRKIKVLEYLWDQYSNGEKGFLRDICPFTTLGTFNRGTSGENRRKVAAEVARLVGVEDDPPSAFDAIPDLDPRNSWFFGYEKDRDKDDIDKLWALFLAAKALVEEETEDGLADRREEFVKAYDAATKVWNASWFLSVGLFWAHPWEFPPLDTLSREYIKTRLEIAIPDGPQGPCDGSTYLEIADDLRERFQDDGYPIHSFPELSLKAWEGRFEKGGSDNDGGGKRGRKDDGSGNSGTEKPTGEGDLDGTLEPGPGPEPYGVQNIMEEGCFLDEEQVKRMLGRLELRKNLILQGPPGTGKTWIAKRLAFALMGKRDKSRIRSVQFHPNLSYEDFVRGWRPGGDGKLVMAEGVFMEAIAAARKEPDGAFAVIIEEINRGNPAQIFGELLTLLEDGKRTEADALELCYPDADGNRDPVYLPENLHVIGTMNIADRSLALVDLAFRRRFAFVGLEPKLGSAWQNWVTTKCGVDSDLAEDIKRRVEGLNAKIAEAHGRQFEIGHSYVTPLESDPLEPGGTREWFRDVAETEIGPLLEEYWFDAPERAKEALEGLLKDW